MPALIIGFGNPLRGDDGAGWHAAQRLREQYGPAQVRVIAAQQLAPEMAQDVAQASLVIFVDAEQGECAGRVNCRPVVARAEAPRTFTHDLSPAALVQCARMLYRKNPPAYLVSAALPRIAREVQRLVEES